ncbi:hypothetical protein CSV72_08980 [Sporosarcina sp. P20a]|nr:hypothetical protein CSV72_08980 [Sporosarcina sp. P20a]
MVVVLRMLISMPYPTFKRGWRKDYAAAGLFHFWFGAWLDWLLRTEVGECLLSGLAQARGGLPTASQLAKFRQLALGHGLPRSCACATKW